VRRPGLIGLMLATVQLTAAPGLAAQAKPLAFLAGCWQGSFRGGGVIEEHYTTPSADLVLGTTRYLRDGRAIDFELTLIRITDSGTVLTPYPKGTASVSFRQKELGEAHVVWENLAHDFPKRVIYRRLAADSLLARIEDDARGREWRMGRAACF
jgi:hypothetical protein